MSRPPRFFISPGQISGSRVTITGDDVRHIGAVLRMKAGERLLLSDGAGSLYEVAISSLDKASVIAEIMNKSEERIASPRIILGQGLPKSDKMDLIVQKATELGVSAIVPLMTERTIVKVRDEAKRIDRWQKIAREAAMQSSRPDIPRVEEIRSLRDFISSPAPGLLVDSGALLLMPWEEGTEPIKDVLRRNPGIKDVIVLIGPEGGFSSSEAALAKDRGFHPVSLGPTILRTETAAIAVLSMIGYEYR